MTKGVPRKPEAIERLKKEILSFFLSRPHATLSAACHNAGVGISTVYEWRHKDPEFDNQIEIHREKTRKLGGDFAESKLMESIHNGNLTAIIFYLKTQHKDRGYIEKDLNIHAHVRPRLAEEDKQILEDMGVKIIDAKAERLNH